MNQAIGRPTPYIDARAKVTGQARYTDDYHFPRMLHVKLLRSPHAHARIKNIDISRARQHPGVAAVTVGADIPAKFGILPVSRDESAMAIDKVRYVGEIVAAVAGETEEAATQAVELIEVEYEPLHQFLNPDDSLQADSGHEPIHAHSRNDTNIHKTAELSFNDPRQALEQSPYL